MSEKAGKSGVSDSEGDAPPSPSADKPKSQKPLAPEVNGPKGPEPTRYGDWERKGIASDF